MAISINSEVVHLFREAENLHLEMNGYKFELSLQGLKQMKQACILGCNFLALIDLVTINSREMKLVFELKGQNLETRIFHE